MVEGEQRRNITVSTARFLIQYSSCATPAIFRCYGSKRYEPIDDDDVPVMAWLYAYLLICLLSTNANALLILCRYFTLIFFLLSISHDTPSVDMSSRQVLPSCAAATSQACCIEGVCEILVSACV